MKHNIIVKFKDINTLNELDHIKEIFKDSNKIEGINSVEYFITNTDLKNRYHLMITLDMTKEGLERWKECDIHIRWKDEYTEKIESKAIFDYDK